MPTEYRVQLRTWTLVILTDDKTHKLLVETNETKSHDTDSEYARNGISCVRFGKLNLIVCRDKETFDTWKEGTVVLKKRRPVLRADAMKFFANLRKQKQ